MKSIFRLDSQCKISYHLHGGKAFGLWQLLKVGANIPETIVVPVGVEIDLEATTWIAKELPFYNHFIVRSSAQDEDKYSQSMAGVFCSYTATLNELSQAADKIRKHAQQRIKPGTNPRISLIIQPYLTGIGGVYLAAVGGKREHLTLSRYGVTAVTSGVTNSIDQLHKNTREYKIAITECRNIHKALGGSIDLELLVKQDSCMFIQYRPLNNWEEDFSNPNYSNFLSIDNYLLTQEVTDPNLISFLNKESNYLYSYVDPIDEISEYFPFPLSPLCGTLWIQQINKLFEVNSYYKNGFILGLKEDNENINIELSDLLLEKTCRFYKKKLFTNWRKKLRVLRASHYKSHPVSAWKEIHASWSLFLNEYFRNPYEIVVSKARSVCPDGSAFSPKVRQRILDYLSAKEAFSQRLISKKDSGDWKEIPEVKIYFQRHGHQLLFGNDFDKPALVEQPEAFLASLELPQSVELNYQYERSPILEAAWLAEDDNEYKHLFAYQLRLAIIRLSEYLVNAKILSSSNSIWDFTIEELDHILTGEVLEAKELALPLQKEISPSNLICKGSFPAILLSSGSASGQACQSSSLKPESILVRLVLREADYPALMASNGAVVALGSVDSHAAIFARDISKPLYLCPALVGSIADGVYLQLHSESMKIVVTPWKD